jgi:hypothetical protein
MGPGDIGPGGPWDGAVQRSETQFGAFMPGAILEATFSGRGDIRLEATA